MYVIARITDMHNKEVINIHDGTRLGFVDDVEVDTCTAQIVAIVVFGRKKLCGILGKEPDIVIHWKEIEVIGEDTILVKYKCPPGGSCTCRSGPHILGGLFR